LEYYERRYYNKLKDDYYKLEIFDSIYRCPFCYNKDYSLSDLLRHASRIADNSRKPIKDIARHSVLITYILRIITTLKEEIDVARTNEAFSMSVEPVEEHSVTELVVSIEETDEHVEVQTHFSYSLSARNSSMSDVNSSPKKDKSCFPHSDSVSTVAEIIQSKLILSATFEYYESKIEGTPSNQLPNIVEFQNTDGRKIVMPDDAHVQEEKASDSGKTYSDMFTSGKLSCSDLEPSSSHIRHASDVKETKNFMFVPTINPNDGGVCNAMSNTHAFKEGDDSISTCHTYNKGDVNFILGNGVFDRTENNLIPQPYNKEHDSIMLSSHLFNKVEEYTISMGYAYHQRVNNMPFASWSYNKGESTIISFGACKFLGAQDTLYDHIGRHDYKDCYIEGSVDFIFGNAISLFEGCHVHAISRNTRALTAQGDGADT
jgi:hypothetical protein